MSEALTDDPAAETCGDPTRGRARAGSPVLSVGGFKAPLDWLVEMARGRKIDLARLSIVALVDAFVDAMDQALWQAPERTAAELSRWAAWTVMAAQLTELRSRLLLPADGRDAGAAHRQAEALRRQAIRREAVATAADWLERRPRLGLDVFARFRPDLLRPDLLQPDLLQPDGADPTGLQDAPVHGGDLTDLLRACLVALRLPAETATCRPRRPAFWSVSEAAARISRLLDERPDGAALDALLPQIADVGASRELRCRAAVAATFVAGLELSRGGSLALKQDEPWRSIHVRRSVA